MADSASARPDVSPRPTVLITEPIGASGLRILERSCTCIVPWRDGAPDATQPQRLRAQLAAVDAVVVRLFPVGDTSMW